MSHVVTERSRSFRHIVRDTEAHAAGIVSQLRVAISGEQIVVHYQPKIDLVTGEVVGVEALVRWEHPERGPMFPDAFLPAAEAAELLLLMGCDQGQGYHWTKPLPGPDIADWLARHTTAKPVSAPSGSGGAPIPSDEAQRIAVLRRYRILDTAFEAIFDDIASAAAKVCGTPISAVSLVDSDRQWFKAIVGLPVRETSRDLAFCAHTITEPSVVAGAGFEPATFGL